MSIEFVGMIGTRPASEVEGAAVSIIGGSVDRDFVREFSRAHEDGGFDPGGPMFNGWHGGGADDHGV